MMQNWQSLQILLKEEQYTIKFGIRSFEYQIENEIKHQLIREVNDESHLFYQTHINVLEESSIVSEIQKKYLIGSDSKLFDDSLTYTNQLLQMLSENPRLFSSIFNFHNNIPMTPSIKSLIQTVVHIFYDNISSDTMWDQPIMKLLSDVIQNEIIRAPNIEALKWDKKESLGQHIMEEFSRRSENVKYTKFIFKNVLVQITRIDGSIYLDPLKISMELKKVSDKRDQRIISQTTTPSSRNQTYRSSTMIKAPNNLSVNQLTNSQQPIFGHIPMPQTNMATYYTQILRYYDQTKKKDLRKQVNQISDSLAKILIFNEEQKQAKFTSLDKKQQVEIDTSPMKGDKQSFTDHYNSLTKIENKYNSDVKRVLNKSIEKLTSLVNSLMDSVFKNLYTIPVGIRILCKFIELQLKFKFPDASEMQVQGNIFSFIFNVWLIPQFEFPKQYQTLKFIKEDHDHTVQLIQQIMRKLIRRQKFDDADDQYYSQLNTYILDLQPSLKEYLNEFLNLSPDPINQVIKIDSEGILLSNDNITKSNCICMPLVDVRTLCILLKDMDDGQNKSQISNLTRRAIRTLEISEHKKFFGKRTDLIPGKELDNTQVYALILDFQLPKKLHVDYQKLIKDDIQTMNATKRLANKVKKTLRVILTDMVDLQAINLFSQQGVTLNRLFQIEEEVWALIINTIKQKQTCLKFNNKLLLQIKYAQQIMTQLPEEYQENNLKLIYDEMNQEYLNRLNVLQETTNETKLELMRAKENIKKNNMNLKDTLDKLTIERSRKQIYEFIEKTPIKWCITSPKTRVGLYSMKAMRMRNNQQMEEDKIWVEDQKECIHNAINLEFIKQIVGGGATDTKSNTNSKSNEFQNYHCEDIKGFIEIFAQLPEVKESVLTGEDKAGVKKAYFEFLTPLVEYLSEKEEMKQDLAWVTEALEKYVSRKIYERVFPKERTYKDVGLYLRIKTLEWLTYEHLEISRANQVDEMWNLAAEVLLQMDNSRTAIEKMDAMIQCTKMMSDVLKLTSVKDEAASADTTLPIMIYIILKAAPQRFYSNLKQFNVSQIISFIELFINDNKMVSEAGYCLKQIQSATSWLETFHPKLIRLNMNEQEYNKYSSLFIIDCSLQEKLNMVYITQRKETDLNAKDSHQLRSSKLLIKSVLKFLHDESLQLQISIQYTLKSLTMSQYYSIRLFICSKEDYA